MKRLQNFDHFSPEFNSTGNLFMGNLANSVDSSVLPCLQN